MNSLQQSQEIFIDETERKPNMYASRVLSGIVGVIAVVWLLNETGIFEVDKLLVRICLAISLAFFLTMQFIVHNKTWIVRPGVKYIFMAMILALVLTVTVLLNIHAVLAYVLPILLAMQYRSVKMSRIALIGSCAACCVAPVLSYFADTWNLNFMTGYIQTFCKVTISVSQINGISVADAVKQILLYWSLPQALTIAAFGIILFSVTKSGIDSVNNQMQVSDLSGDLAKQLLSVQTMQERVLYSMSDMIENRDTETGGHVRRTSEIVRLIMGAMQQDSDSGVTEIFCNNVIKCAPMHDLGKLAVPDTILRKPDELTSEEYEIVKLHPIKSAEIIKRALTGIEDENLVTIALNIAEYHHERMDGKGYPHSLKGKDIPLEARIMAIADVYDALVSRRCYKEPMSFEEAYSAIETAMGTQFDPDLNKYFIACREEIEAFYSSTETQTF